MTFPEIVQHFRILEFGELSQFAHDTIEYYFH